MEGGAGGPRGKCDRERMATCISARYIVTPNSAIVSNVNSTSSFATRFARRSEGFLKADLHSARNHQAPTFLNSVSKSINKKYDRVFSSGSIDARSIIGVHRAIKEDPFHKGLLGTKDLRASRSHYVSARCFSLILATPKFPWSHTHSPAGSAAPVNISKHNKSFDLEAQNEGEYWLVFRGFLQLQRDVAVGKMAAQRAQGFGHVGHRKEEGALRNRKKGSSTKGKSAEGTDDDGRDEKGKKKSSIAKRVMSLLRHSSSSSLSSVEDESGSPKGPQPPPADYFLGFNSPGTQIWARLRQAGLETKCVYALDTKRVMIKLRCAPERLEDVAEVLRMKVRPNPRCINDSSSYATCFARR